MEHDTVTAIVETRQGKVRGHSVQGVQVFRGLRYADTTAGANRFRAPQPLPAWSGVRDALRNTPACPQLARPQNTDPFFSWYSAIESTDEDCLGLNLFTPGLDGARRPVLFWIHGGGWREYSGAAPGFDGTNLARAEDVVVISINHRLGVLGFLKLDTEDERFADSGNAGILDVVAALEWVRDNVAAFGGDPDNVTVFGESGGASKTAALLSMRRARGLFHKAVLQSSGGGMRLASPEDAGALARQLADALGRDRLDPQEMQALPVGTILEATRRVGGSFRGMIDHRSFDGDPFGDTAPAAGAGVPLLAGCTLTETTYYMRSDARNFALSWDDTRRRLSALFETDGDATDRIIDSYRQSTPGASASDVLFLASSDFVFKRNTWRMAALQAEQAPVWSYHFEWCSPVEGGRMGAPHTCEIPFIFGTTGAAGACVGEGPEQEAMTRRMMAAWAAFARTGDPNNDSLPDWPRYDGTARQTMVLDATPRVERDPGGTARAALDGLPWFGYFHNLAAIANG